jgi:hypothetical protein
LVNFNEFHEVAFYDSLVDGGALNFLFPFSFCLHFDGVKLSAAEIRASVRLAPKLPHLSDPQREELDGGL